MTATYGASAATTPGVDGRAVAGSILGDDGGAQPSGQVARAVTRSVVDDDGAEAGWNVSEHRRQSAGLVATGNDDVALDGAHALDRRDWPGRFPCPSPYESVTSAQASGSVGCGA